MSIGREAGENEANGGAGQAGASLGAISCSWSAFRSSKARRKLRSAAASYFLAIDAARDGSNNATLGAAARSALIASWSRVSRWASRSAIFASIRSHRPLYAHRVISDWSISSSSPGSSQKSCPRVVLSNAANRDTPR